MPSALFFFIFMATGSPLALNMLLPILPTLAQTFQASTHQVQLSLSLYLAALAIGQLLVGGLINLLGMRKTLLLGLLSFIIGSLFGLSQLSLMMILLGRLLQGLGGAIMISLARALLVGCYGMQKAPQKMGYIVMAIALSQSIAPLLGGYIHAGLGWSWIFGVCALQGVLLWLLCLYYVPATNKPSNRFSIYDTLQLYSQLLQANDFRRYAISNTLVACCFYLFVSATPYLTRDFPGSVHHYGYWFMSISIAFMLGGYLSTRLNQYFSVDRTIVMANLISLLGAVALVVTQIGFEPSYANLFIPMCFVTLGRGIGQPSYQSAAIGTTSHQSGMAAGLMGFLQLTAGALVSQLAPSLIVLWPPLLSLSLLLCMLIATYTHRRFNGAG